MAIPAPADLLLVVAGPSGVGKGTVLKRVMARRSDLRFSVSANTRPRRPAEQEGVDYYFVTEDEFRGMIARDEFFEWADVYGELKGTPRSELERARAEGKGLVAEVDHQGAMSFRRNAPEAVLVFIAPPSWPALEERLRGRHTEDEGRVQRRLQAAVTEIAAMTEYDYVIVNDGPDRAADELEAIIEAESLAAPRERLKELRERLLAEARAVGMGLEG